MIKIINLNEKTLEEIKINENNCINCKKCIREIGCPAITTDEGRVHIEPSLCYGCGLCSQICPVHAISGGDSK